MKNLLDVDALTEIKKRLALLNKQSKRQWGKMEIGQMLAHCSKVMDMASGATLYKQLFMGKIFGPFAKSSFYDDSKVRRNLGANFSSPFDTEEEHDFELERNILLKKIEAFQKAGPDACTKGPHVVFGPLTSEQWGKGMYKHLDHHLKQFDS